MTPGIGRIGGSRVAAGPESPSLEVLMNPLKVFRKIFNMLAAGEIPPSYVAYGVCLGLYAALMPQGLAEPTTWLLVALVFLTRASLGFFLTVASVFKLALAAGGWTVVSATGRAALETSALEGLWKSLFALPVVPLLGLERYAAMGGLLWATLLSLLLFWPTLKFVVWFREHLGPSLAEMKLVKWLLSSWFGPLIKLLFFGARKLD